MSDRKVRCPECGRKNPQVATFCLNCGRRLPPATPASSSSKQVRDEEGSPGHGAVREVETETGHPMSSTAPPRRQEPSILRWKIAVVALSVAVVALAASTAFFVVRSEKKETRVEVLTEKKEELSRENTTLLLALESIETVSRKAAQVIEKYLVEEGEEAEGWKGYVIDALRTIEDLTRAYQEVLESGDGDESFIEKVEKLIDEFLEPESDK